jgi:polysaccharide export outer membrane protein
MHRALILLLLAFACASPPHPSPRDPELAKPIGSPDDGRLAQLYQARTSGNGADYCLGPGDLLTVNVFGWDAMKDVQTRVSSTGAVALPMIGDVPAGGRTETQLQAEIEQRLRNGYMRDPHVTVFVQRYQSQQVSVTGAVARPGLYSLTRDNRTVYDLLSQAGGLTEQAGGRVLLSPAEGARCDGSGRPSHAAAPALHATAGAGFQTASAASLEPIEFDLEGKVPAGQVNPLTLPVMGGDSLVVTRGRFMVDGWVAKPGLYTFTPGMTAYGAMSVAGGALYPANLGRTQIIRARRDGTKELLEVDLNRVGHGEAQDVALREGDVVRFNASSTRMVPYSVYWIFNNLFRVGAGISVAGV